MWTRSRLEAWLHAVALSPEVRRERKRHARVAESIEEVRPVPRGEEAKGSGLARCLHLKMRNIPPGSQPEARELKIEFFGAEDLVR